MFFQEGIRLKECFARDYSVLRISLATEMAVCGYRLAPTPQRSRGWLRRCLFRCLLRETGESPFPRYSWLSNTRLSYGLTT